MRKRGEVSNYPMSVRVMYIAVPDEDSLLVKPSTNDTLPEIFAPEKEIDPYAQVPSSKITLFAICACPASKQTPPLGELKFPPTIEISPITTELRRSTVSLICTLRKYKSPPILAATKFTRPDKIV